MLLYFMPKQLSIAQPSTYAGQNFPVARAITTQSFLLQNKEAKLLGFLLLYSLRPRSTITMQLFHCKIKISKILKRYSHKAGDVQTLQSRLALTPPLYARRNEDLKDLQTLKYAFILYAKAAWRCNRISI